MNEKQQIATFGNGCFWCTEAVFQKLKGVLHVEPGYCGGHVVDPTYSEVCAGSTGHAEVIRIAYDSNQVSFIDLLEVFWKTHDPTTLNRQGNDIGTQYRSVIFYHSEEQQQLAEEFRQKLVNSGAYQSKIVTEIVAVNNYFTAEKYHHDYFSSHGHEPYCAMVVGPKVEKFQKVFANRLK